MVKQKFCGKTLECWEKNPGILGKKLVSWKKKPKSIWKSTKNPLGTVSNQTRSQSFPFYDKPTVGLKLNEKNVTFWGKNEILGKKSQNLASSIPKIQPVILQIHPEHPKASPSTTSAWWYPNLMENCDILGRKLTFWGKNPGILGQILNSWGENPRNAASNIPKI